jgi:hypothetical protein
MADLEWLERSDDDHDAGDWEYDDDYDVALDNDVRIDKVHDEAQKSHVHVNKNTLLAEGKVGSNDVYTRLTSVNPHKAGMPATDKQKVNELIYDISKVKCCSLPSQNCRDIVVSHRRTAGLALLPQRGAKSRPIPVGNKGRCSTHF